jgi:hypothetical protein
MSQCETLASLSWLEMRAGPKKAFVTRASYYLRFVDHALHHLFNPTNGLVQASFVFKTFIVCYYTGCFLDAALNLVGSPTHCHVLLSDASRVDAFCP